MIFTSAGPACIAVLLASVVLRITAVMAQTPNYTYQSFDVSGLGGSYEYAANFTQISPCAPETV